MSKPYALAAALLAALTPFAATRAQTPAAPQPSSLPGATKQAAPAAPQAQSQAQQATQAQPTPAPAAQHEYAPVTEKTFSYKDWTFKSLKDGAPVNLREWARGKKLVMVVYYAPWCPNWKLEAPIAAKLYDKYKAHGFDVIAVHEYGPVEQSQKFFGEAGAPYTVVVESEARDARDKTTHYGYRQACGDTRKWGSPFNVFLEPAKLNQSGEVLAERLFVVSGELIEEDAEQFIRQRLGLDQKASVEPCKIER